MMVTNWLYVTIFPISNLTLSNPSHWVMIIRTLLEEESATYFRIMGGATLVEDLGGLKRLGYRLKYHGLLLKQ